MFSEMIDTFAPAIVAAAVLVPVLVAHVAMFFEGRGERGWKTPRAAA